MRILLIFASLALSDAAQGQNVDLEDARRETPDSLFRRLVPLASFRADQMLLQPRGNAAGELGQALFWSAARPSAGGLTCEADYVIVRFGNGPPIEGGTAYRAVADDSSATAAQQCAAIRPGFLDFFRAGSAEIARYAVEFLGRTQSSLASAQTSRLVLSCANCENPREAFLGLAQERLIEVIQDRCTPEEGQVFCLELRYLGGPFGGWRVRTDGARFVRLVHYSSVTAH